MDLLEYLKQQPKARERKNKNRAIGNLILEKYKLNDIAYINVMSKEQASDMVGEILSLDRKWRKILEENPELRGTDYGDKEMLAQEKQIELGYLPGFHEDLRKLKTLTN